MKIVSWNVNGIRAVLKKDALEPMLKALQPDVLCLQETKIQEDQIDFDTPVGYTAFWNSAERKGYSSTAILSKSKPINITTGFSDIINQKYEFIDEFGDTRTEGRVTTAEFDDFFLVTVYTPNSKDKLERIPMRARAWDPAFLEHCQELKKTKPVIFCGDLNVAHKEIDLARPKENDGKKGFTQEEREGFDNFLTSGFIDTFRQFHPDKPDQYTWWTMWGKARERNVGWRIDYFLVSESLKSKLKDANIHPDIMGSDHCPISLEL